MMPCFLFELFLVFCFCFFCQLVDVPSQCSLLSQVLNLRIKGSLQGEGGGFDFANLRYLSLHTLDSQSGFLYAQTRVARELLDAWLQKWITFNGQRFEDADVTLTEQDSPACFLTSEFSCRLREGPRFFLAVCWFKLMLFFGHHPPKSLSLLVFSPSIQTSQELKGIPGAEHLACIDSMPLQVCVRKGTQIALHPDQVKQWTNSGAEIADDFSKLKEEHDSKYLNMLTSVIQTGNQSAMVAADGAVEAEADGEPAPLPPNGGQQKVTFESMAKRVETDPVEVKCMSEISGVELLLGKSGNVYVCSEKDKILPKFAVLGGYGTGKWLVFVSAYVSVLEFVSWPWAVLFAKC